MSTVCYNRSEKREESQEWHTVPSCVVREGCLEEATTKVGADLWKKLAGRWVQKLERALPIDSEQLEWGKGGRVVKVRGTVVVG